MGWAVPPSPSLGVPVLAAYPQPQIHVGKDQRFWLSLQGLPGSTLEGVTIWWHKGER